jgi:glycosyltransferase involved in cell wall biosynthesis
VVFCVSEATRSALTLAYPSVSDKTRLLPQYVDWPESFEAIDRNLPLPVLGRYAAVIGTLEPRKNLALLIKALARPEIRDSDIRFVVIGKQGWNIEQFLDGLTPADRQHLLFSGFVTEFMKYRLLRHADFLVFPSMYEGFGIPALEAMSLAKPVLAAMTSSFPEVIGDAGVYFDPLSVNEFAAAFKEIANPVKIAELAPKAQANASLFDWRRMADPVVRWVRGE